MEKKKKTTTKKPKERKPTDSVRIVPGTYGPDWWNYPPEWDEQVKRQQKLEEENNKNKLQ